MIGTAVLGLARLFLIAVLAVIQFFWSARRRRRLREPYRGSIEVLVPAYNEEKIICRTVEALLAARTLGAPPQVVVIDDGSKDRTSEVLRERFADEPRVTVLRKENGGKAAALNYGIAGSTADVIVAIDGDTIVLPGRDRATDEVILRSPRGGGGRKRGRWKRAQSDDALPGARIRDESEPRSPRVRVVQRHQRSAGSHRRRRRQALIGARGYAAIRSRRTPI